jgi:hypothetical protein
MSGMIFILSVLRGLSQRKRMTRRALEQLDFLKIEHFDYIFGGFSNDASQPWGSRYFSPDDRFESNQ